MRRPSILAAGGDLTGLGVPAVEDRTRDQILGMYRLIDLYLDALL